MFERYAIYYTANGAFASHGAAWLGWDVSQGQSVPQPDIAGLDLATLTQTPRKYGFHATLKAPFRLAKGTDEAGLTAATETCARQLSPLRMEGLEVAALGPFLALVPLGDATALRAHAAQIVQSLDRFRAPPTPEELARRRKSRLSAAQEQNLQRWGYPHVMDQFRFHMTLTNRLPGTDIARIKGSAVQYFAPVLPHPFELDALTLVGQRANGKFVSIKRFRLA